MAADCVSTRPGEQCSCTGELGGAAAPGVCDLRVAGAIDGNAKGIIESADGVGGSVQNSALTGEFGDTIAGEVCDPRVAGTVDCETLRPAQSSAGKAKR